MSSITIGILAIQGDFDQHLSVFDAIKQKIRQQSTHDQIPFKTILVRDKESLSQCDGLIIPGGESTTIGVVCKDYNLIEPLKDFINNPNKYVWGLCAGLILLSNKLINNQQLTHFEANEKTNIADEDVNHYTRNSYEQPLLGGLDVMTHRNFFGSQCNSTLKRIYIIDDCNGDNDNNKVIESQSHFIRAPMIVGINNKENDNVNKNTDIQTLAYIYDNTENSDGNRRKLVTCVEDRIKNIMGTVFHPEVTYLNNNFDNILNIDTYWHEYFLKRLFEIQSKKYNNSQSTTPKSIINLNSKPLPPLPTIHSSNLSINIYNPHTNNSHAIRAQTQGKESEAQSLPIYYNLNPMHRLMCNSVSRAFPLMLHGGVIMDVVNPIQARIAEEAGACSVMALERIPADIKKDGGVARMSDPYLISSIKNSVSIPIMAKARIGHFGEAKILSTIGIDCIDESEVLTPADEKYHINKHLFSNIPFVCGAKDLGEALRRISEGASMIRLKGNAGTGNVMEAVRHARLVFSEINKLKCMNYDEIFNYSKEIGVSVELVILTKKMGRLPVTTFAAGGIATPADVLLMMSLGCDGVFVGSGIFKSSNPAKRARAIVHACTYYKNANIVCKVSENLGKAMVGILNKGEKYQFIHHDSKL